MEAYRHSYTVKDNQIIVSLPSNFKAKKVDVIILPAKEKDWYDDLTFEQRKSIERGREQLKAGKGIPHEDVKKRIRKLIENKKTA